MLKLGSYINTTERSQSKSVSSVLHKCTQQFGRSMIEMLSVLGIIGVLSVAGIAGYTQAMHQWRLNKQADQFFQILQGAWQYMYQIYPTTNGHTKVTKLFYAAGVIPRDMKKTNNEDFFYDAFNNQSYIYCQIDGGNFCGMPISIKNAAASQCRNILNMARAFHPFLWMIEVNDTSGGGSYSGHTFGDGWCTDARRQAGTCLENLTITRMNSICRTCDRNPGKTCNVYILWKKTK